MSKNKLKTKNKSEAKNDKGDNKKPKNPQHLQVLTSKRKVWAS